MTNDERVALSVREYSRRGGFEPQAEESPRANRVGENDALDSRLSATDRIASTLEAIERYAKESRDALLLIARLQDRDVSLDVDWN